VTVGASFAVESTAVADTFCELATASSEQKNKTRMTLKSVVSGFELRGIRQRDRRTMKLLTLLTIRTVVFSSMAASQHNPPAEVRKVKQSKTVVLGPQASPPARVQPNQEHWPEPLEEIELVLLDAGRRDACGPRTMVFDCFHCSVMERLLTSIRFIQV